jgi:hypothetical protein
MIINAKMSENQVNKFRYIFDKTISEYELWRKDNDICLYPRRSPNSDYDLPDTNPKATTSALPVIKSSYESPD